MFTKKKPLAAAAIASIALATTPAIALASNPSAHVDRHTATTSSRDLSSSKDRSSGSRDRSGSSKDHVSVDRHSGR